MGFTLLMIPNISLPIVEIPVSNEPWRHLLGFVLICSSYYYLHAAQKRNIDFARYTTHTRFAAPLVVVFLVLTGKADFHFFVLGCDRRIWWVRDVAGITEKKHT
jgi:hypothetical protein